MSLADYSLLSDWRDHPENPNVVIRADGSMKPKNAIVYGTLLGTVGAKLAFTQVERNRMNYLLHGVIDGSNDKREDSDGSEQPDCSGRVDGSTTPRL